MSAAKPFQSSFILRVTVMFAWESMLRKRVTSKVNLNQTTNRNQMLPELSLDLMEMLQMLCDASYVTFRIQMQSQLSNSLIK